MMKVASHLGLAVVRKNIRFALLGLSLAVVLACQPTTAKPTLTPSSIYAGPPLQTATLRQGLPPDVLAQLDFGGLGGGGALCSTKPDRPVIAYEGEQEFSSGEIAHITSLDVSDIGDFPSLCVNSLDLMNAALAISPNGVAIRPYAGPFPDQSDWGEVWLPLVAFSQPGLWHLVIDTPGEYFDLGIEVPTPMGPTVLQDWLGHCSQIWLGGFDPNERVVVAAIGNGLEGAFDVQVDAHGYALVDIPPDVGFYYWVIGENGNVDCGNCEPEMSAALYDFYWRGGSGEVAQTAIRACPEALPPRLSFGTYGHIARVTFTNGTPLRVRSQPSTTAEIIYRLPEGAVVIVAWGPVCAEGWMWWKIYAGDKHEIVGWAAEGDSQAGYFLEPWQ